MFPASITKRNGAVVPFDATKIQNAIAKAYKEVHGINNLSHYTDEISLVTNAVVTHIPHASPKVEEIQDVVEMMLMKVRPEVAKVYIIYRNKRNEIREQLDDSLYEDDASFFLSSYNNFISLRTYSKWNPSLGRRETWSQTVNRFMNFLIETSHRGFTADERAQIHMAILHHEVMPSMRALQFAGAAARRNHLVIYNCCYIAPTCIADLKDLMYVLMNGCGCGFSVENQYVSQFPVVTPQTGVVLPTFVVPDSKEGWCLALEAGLEAWYSGQDIEFDYSLVRPEGARLKIMGGRASGPKPLMELLNFARDIILSKQGSKLTALNLHDIICYIGRVVVVGATRRSAQISLSDLDDEEMRDAKSGDFYINNMQRFQANNSAVYQVKPSDEEFHKEWEALIASNSGERGIFNRSSLRNTLPQGRLDLLGDRWMHLGTNPCGEILLQSHGLCNLTTIALRTDDTVESIRRKARISAMIGTWQSTLTNFGFVSEKFKQNAEEERLLGCSMTGMFDCNAVWDPEVLEGLKQLCIDTNAEYAAKFGISPSTCVTCIKPEGTCSELLGTSSGMHPRFSPFYIRRVRAGNTDPLSKMLIDQGVPHVPEVGQTLENVVTWVFEFPQKSPSGSKCTKDVSAIEMLQRWLLIKKHYTQHNPSVTIYVGKDEWDAVERWVLDNWEYVGGLTFIPRGDMVYQLAPFEEISKEKYYQLVDAFPKIDYSQLQHYEKTGDDIELKKEFACTAGGCFS